MREPDHKYIASLVVLAQNNDNNAFAELYALTYNKVYNYARHYLRDDYLAQDAVQEVYISALKNINKIKDPSLFIAWINQISFHVCFDMTQKQKPLGMADAEEELLEAVCDEHPDSNPEKTALLKDEHHRLEEAIKKLPSNERQCIYMKFYNNKKLDEIADIMNISKSTVKRYLASAEASLQQIMKK